MMAAVAALGLGATLGGFTIGGMTAPTREIPYSRIHQVETAMSKSTVPISVDPGYSEAQRDAIARVAVDGMYDCFDLAGRAVACGREAVDSPAEPIEAARLVAPAQEAGVFDGYDMHGLAMRVD